MESAPRNQGTISEDRRAEMNRVCRLRNASKSDRATAINTWLAVVGCAGLRSSILINGPSCYFLVFDRTCIKIVSAWTLGDNPIDGFKIKVVQSGLLVQ